MKWQNSKKVEKGKPLQKWRWTAKDRIIETVENSWEYKGSRNRNGKS